jgi:hypothetical protein
MDERAYFVSQGFLWVTFKKMYQVTNKYAVEETRNIILKSLKLPLFNVRRLALKLYM